MKKGIKIPIIFVAIPLFIIICYGMYQVFSEHKADKYVTTTVNTLSIPTIQLGDNMTLSQVTIENSRIEGVLKNNSDKKFKIYHIDFSFFNTGKPMQKIDCSVDKPILSGESTNISGDLKQGIGTYNSVEIKVNYR